VVAQGLRAGKELCRESYFGTDARPLFERRMIMAALEMKYFVLKPKAKSKTDAYARASQQAMLAYAKVIQQETNDFEFAQAIKKWAREEHAIQMTFETPPCES
jgi:hypothetical protein